MPSPFRTLTCVAIICLTLAACSRVSSTVKAAGELKADKDRKEAPDFILKDSNGASVKLSDYKGKVVLLDFWATWCGPCKIEIPWFMEYEKQFKDRGFAVLGVSMDDGGWDDVKPYIQERGINYRILMGTDQVGQAYGGVDSLPTTFLIDRSGRIATVHVGLEKGKNEIRDEIEGLLNTDQSARNSALLAAPAFVTRAN